ncbi:MAG: 50S ribosomal protein L19, partial [Myxococcota bacterium]
DKIEIVSSGKVRRAKLYYLRGLQGKKARLKARDQWGKKKKAKAEAAPVVEEAEAAPVENAEAPATAASEEKGE